MLSFEDVRLILKDVEIPNLEFVVIEEGKYLWLRVEFWAPCTKDGEMKHWKGRKWLLSKHMTESEVVGTAFKAVMTAAEHEIRESFRYKGKAIFGPHISVEALLSVADIEEVRPEAG